MNNQTHEALKMAIEGYEQCLDDLQGWAAYASEYFQDKWDLEGEVKDHRDKIQSCKEALEQPAQEYDVNELIDKITPENLQEPVAYADYERGTCYLIGTPIPKDEIANPLYTHPAQPLTRDWIGTALERADKDEAFRKGLIGELAQPLSDDEITEIYKKWLFDINVNDFARAIEQAHGIGVKDDLYKSE